MHNITLLSSFHIKTGKCNPDELYKIIEEINPEIIFEELCHGTFNRIYSEGVIPQSLEAFTIKNYLRSHKIEHFPVDTYEINEADVFNKYDLISDKSKEYTELFKQNLSMIAHSGYEFLNSDISIDLISKMNVLEETVLIEMNDDKVYSQYKIDRWIHDKRESEMLQNIYYYSKLYHYNKAMFICGAEHRKSLIKKIQDYEKNEELKLNWTFYNS